MWSSKKRSESTWMNFVRSLSLCYTLYNTVRLNFKLEKRRTSSHSRAPLAAVSVSLLLCEKMNDRKNRLWNWSRIFSHSFFFFLPPVHTSNRRLSRSNFHLFSSMGLHAQLFHTDFCTGLWSKVKWLFNDNEKRLWRANITQQQQQPLGADE